MRKLRSLSAAAILVLGGTAALASTVIGLSVEDQARLSKFVVVGTVLGQKGVVHPDNGIETQVTLKVTEVLAGSVRPGDVVAFHTRGGQVGDEVSEAIGEAQLQTGQEVLVFLEEVNGRLHNLGLSMGVWSLRHDPAGQTLLTRAVQDGLEVVGEAEVEYGPLSLSEMSRRVDQAKRQPAFEHPQLRGLLVEGGK